MALENSKENSIGRSYEYKSGIGTVLLGVPTFLNGGAGNWTADEIAKYCNFHGISFDVCFL